MLSALRLCVWRFNNCYMELFNINQTFSFTLRAKEWKIFESGIFSNLVACLVPANGATNKICFCHIYHFISRSLSCFFFSSRYLRMSLFRTGMPTPIRSTTAKIVKSILSTSHFFIFHNLDREPDRHGIHNYNQHNRKDEKQHR